MIDLTLTYTNWLFSLKVINIVIFEENNMDMKVNSPLITQLRNSKAWSQQQLSEISNLSLRTVQRVEKSGNASQETIKSIASAFELNVDELLIVQTETIIQKTKSALFWKLGLAMSAVLGTAVSLTAFVPTTTPLSDKAIAKADAVTQQSTVTFESVSSTFDMKHKSTTYIGNVKVTIPSANKTKLFAQEMTTKGEKIIAKGGVRLTMGDKVLSFHMGTLRRTDNSLTINAEQVTYSTKS